ncbi:hypothetical protein Y032_0010g919 [Ancylostoma ceylanicum]|uniref:Uncharacterized protein n=1 Tax=Ancylostoma ceylanicum TaxID=53326 RepID=A0A016VIW3_9BILA|nr:hypothetical protein Y032_0010g919 [Ancylostoma ceylanicum]
MALFFQNHIIRFGRAMTSRCKYVFVEQSMLFRFTCVRGKLSHFCKFSQLRNPLPCKKKTAKHDDLETKFSLFFDSQFSEFSVQEIGDLLMQ